MPTIPMTVFTSPPSKLSVTHQNFAVNPIGGQNVVQTMIPLGQSFVFAVEENSDITISWQDVNAIGQVGEWSDPLAVHVPYELPGKANQGTYQFN